MIINISERLKLICDMFDCGDTLADVGCDHGYVGIKLIKDDKFKHVIAMDVNAGPLEGAMNNIRSQALEKRISCRLSDGLDALGDNEADAVVIAGMGGSLICRILENNIHKLKGIKQLVLGAQSEIEDVRRFLYEHNLAIDKEDMLLEDGKYYQIIRTFYCDNIKQYYFDNYSDDNNELFDFFGPYLLKSKNMVMHDFLLERKEKTKKVIDVLECNTVFYRNKQTDAEIDVNSEDIKSFDCDTDNDIKSDDMTKKKSRSLKRIGELKSYIRLIDRGLEYYK